jgi:phenylalanyl-tRNA synthetase beta chain
MFGYLGELSDAGRQTLDLRGSASVAEIDVDLLVEAAELIPAAQCLSQFPSISRDLNIVVDESVRWADVEIAVRTSVGELLESIEFQATWRDEKKLGVGKKSLLFSFQLRSSDATLRNERADEIRDKVVLALAAQVGGELRA